MTHSFKEFDVLISRAPNQFLLSKITPNISYALLKNKNHNTKNKFITLQMPH
jgi:hypothetical protein